MSKKYYSTITGNEIDVPEEDENEEFRPAVRVLNREQRMAIENWHKNQKVNKKKNPESILYGVIFIIVLAGIVTLWMSFGVESVITFLVLFFAGIFYDAIRDKRRNKRGKNGSS